MHIKSTSEFIPTLVIFVLVNCLLGTTFAVNWNGNNWALACDFSGNDMSNVRISSDQCGGKCAATAGCTHFAWSSYNGGTCWMKSGPVSPSDARDSSDSSMVCGYMENQPCTGNSCRQYWNCCSMAWMGVDCRPYNGGRPC